MFNGFYDKMSVQESKLILKTKTIEAKNQVKSYYVESSGEYVRNIDGSYIRNNGLSRTILEIYDSWFGDDVSYIRYNTQDVYNVYTKGLDKNFVRKLQKSIKNISDSKYILEVAMRNISFLLPNGGKPLDPFVIEAFLTSVYNQQNLSPLYSDVIFLKQNIEWLKKIGMYTSDLQEILEGYSILTKPIYYFSDWRYVSNYIIGQFSSFLLNIPDPTFMTQVLGIGINFINEILNMPIGNGYSPLENMHDHGLNDWNYQLRNNFSAIGSLAQQASESGNKKFSDGVEWKVTDGWWTLPKLHLRWQGSTRWIDVSPRDSFNWGNKVPPRF